MPASKIQDEAEVIRWFDEGRTLQWMRDEYRRKYNIETSSGMFPEWRKRKGLPPRNTRDEQLIPWAVERDHRYHLDVLNLRVVARQRDGKEVAPEEASRVEGWLAELAAMGAVVHYDPELEDGFVWVPRGPNDRDLIHEPEPGAKLRKRR